MVEPVRRESIVFGRMHVFPLIAVSILNLPPFRQSPPVVLVRTNGPVDLNVRNLLRLMKGVLRPFFSSAPIAPRKERDILVMRTLRLDLIIQSVRTPRPYRREGATLGRKRRHGATNLIPEFGGGNLRRCGSARNFLPRMFGKTETNQHVS